MKEELEIQLNPAQPCPTGLLRTLRGIGRSAMGLATPHKPPVKVVHTPCGRVDLHHPGGS